VKGRDWYDLVWYGGQNIAPDLLHLENRMKQTNHLMAHEKLTGIRLKEKLLERIQEIDWESARKDVENFVKDRASLELWSAAYFKMICDRIKLV